MPSRPHPPLPHTFYATEEAGEPLHGECQSRGHNTWKSPKWGVGRWRLFRFNSPSDRDAWVDLQPETRAPMPVSSVYKSVQRDDLTTEKWWDHPEEGDPEDWIRYGARRFRGRRKVCRWGFEDG